MTYSAHKTVVLIDKSHTLVNPALPYHVQISTYETMRDQPRTRHYHATANSVHRLLATLNVQNFTIDSHYGVYGHWYAVKYYGETLNAY